MASIVNWKKAKNEHDYYRPINLHKTLNYHVNLPQQAKYGNNVCYLDTIMEIRQLQSRNYAITLLFVILMRYHF